MHPHEFWQQFADADQATLPPFADRYPARLPDGRVLFLPIRPLADTDNAIASLILNQCSFAVEAALADALAKQLSAFSPDVVVGMPTLGLSLARLVAERLGHHRFVALGTSRKFWYQDALSVPMSSITSPDAQKRLFVDPRMVPLIERARVCLIDDVISSGTSICAGLELLQKIAIKPICVGAALLQTTRWRAALDAAHPGTTQSVCGVIETPLLQSSGSGWHPLV